MSEQAKRKSIGGVWKNKNEDGGIYLSISVEIDGERHKFFANKNQFKDKETSPDYVIFPPKPREEDNEREEAPRKSYKQNSGSGGYKKAPAKPAPRRQQEEDEGDEVF